MMRIHDHLEFWARSRPDLLCCRDGRRQWSYREVDERANRVGHALRALSVGDGARFSVLAKNCLEWLPIYYGASKVGAVPVPLNYRLVPREWIHLLNDSGAKTVIAQAEYVAGIDSIRSELFRVERFVAIGASAADGWEDFDQLVHAQPASRPDADISPDHALYQMYTSGTTGLPKGAVLTHAAINVNLQQITSAMSFSPGMGVLTVMPLFHAGAAVASFAQVAVGASLLIMADFDPVECVRALDEEGVAYATFVPAMIQAMLVMVPDVRDRSYTGLQAMGYGASPIAEETLRQAMDVFGCEFYQAYGMTECSAVLTLLLPEDHLLALAGRPELLLSCGRPVAGTEIRVVDPSDQDLPLGEVGEIIARGPQLMKGYWKLPEATEESLRGGWMHTGDAGSFDRDGYLYVSDRVKDMIVSGGENIYPREIEDVIFQMPEVADAAVIGVPDEQWGETVKAVVVVREGYSLTDGAVIDWCRERLAGFKRPRSVDFVAEMPRNPSGKVLKKELRARYWEGRKRGVS